MGFPGGALVKNRQGFSPWVRKVPWRRKWQPTPVFMPGKFHGQRNTVGYHPQHRKELDTTEHTHAHTHTHTQSQNKPNCYLFSSEKFLISIKILSLSSFYFIFLKIYKIYIFIHTQMQIQLIQREEKRRFLLDTCWIILFSCTHSILFYFTSFLSNILFLISLLHPGQFPQVHPKVINSLLIRI